MWRNKKNRLWLWGLVAVLLVAGLLVTGWAAYRADQSMRGNLIKQIRLVRQAVDLDQLQLLSGTAADLGTPAYLRLKEQLAAIKQVRADIRFIYLMGRNPDGQLFFFVDNEPVGSENESPAGQIYREATPEALWAFANQVELVEGPASDSWGTWVTGFVPVTDPASGEFIAMLGMDIDARIWSLNVATHAALPAGVSLIVLIGISAVLLSFARRVDSSPKPVLRQLLVPLTIMVLVMTVGIGVFVWYQYQLQRDATLTRRIAEIESHLAIALQKDAAGLTAALQSIGANEHMRTALLAKDTDRLQADWQPVLEAMRRDSRVTHFYFFDSNRTCLLRVHKPEKNGDLIRRFTALEAERSGTIASGIELGPLGTFTLRAVKPIFQDGKRIGYVELGKEIEYTLQQLHDQFSCQLIMTIYKDNLNRHAWEEGMKLLGRKADWNRLRHSAIIYSSQVSLPDSFASIIDHSPGRGRIHDEIVQSTLDGRDWRLTTIALHDVTGHEVGDLLVLLDTTAEKTIFVRLVVFGVMGGAILMTSLLGFIFVLLHRTDQGIARQQGELKESEQRLMLAMRAGAVGIWERDLVNNQLVWDDQMYRLYGLKPEDFSCAEEAWQAALHADDMAQIKAEMEMALRGEKEFDTEFRVVWPDGSIHNIRALATVMCDKSGQSVRLLGTNWDITAQKLVTERAKHMAAEAEQANVAKGAFLANMSHEIRTPMNGVIGMTGLLLETELTTDQRLYTEAIRTSGESLLYLINDILDFSKIEAGKMELEALDFDLQSLLDDLAASLALQAHNKGLELVCAMSSDVPAFLCGDPGRLRQILTNLAGNAIKFTHAGEVAIHVTLESDSQEAVMLRFSVHDTGIGIPVDKIGVLFEKFSQVDASTTRQFGGTGLGLAISKQLAEMMGGEIGVTSFEGQGSEFWFTASLQKQAAAAHAELPLAVDLNGVRLLIVDDNTTNRAVLNRRMSSWGMRVAESADSSAVLQILEDALDDEDPFEVVIIDMQMPDMDGAALGRAIKRVSRLAQTRLVLFSSLGVRGDARQFADIGFDAYLTKPARPLELRGVLCQILAPPEERALKPCPIVTRHTARETVNLFAAYNVRILLAEDNFTNQQVAIGLLRKLGLTADTVGNGAAAVAALTTVPYDLVLMDVQMPEMDGYEATARIRDPQSGVLNHKVPVIAMTANAMAGDREKCLRAGMDDYLSKPVNPTALAQALARWLPTEEAERGGGCNNLDEVVPPEDEAATASAWDKGSLLKRLMDDEALAKVVLAGFVADIPNQITALGQWLERGDGAGVERQAHSIKGAAANVAGDALGELAAAMEIAAKAGELDRVQADMAELEKRFERFKDEIRTYLDGNN